MLRVFRNYFRSTDSILHILTALCTGYGLLLVYSAGLNISSGARNFQVQCIGILLGIAAAFVITLFDYRNFNDIWLILVGAICGLLLITAVFGTGPTGSGNHNWINLGFINLQTSEFTKLIFIIVLASLIDQLKGTLNGWRCVAVMAAFVALVCALLLLTGDLGMTIIYFCIALVMLFVAGLKARYFLIVGMGACAVFPLAWAFLLKDYMKMRILAGFNPYYDASNYGYQAIQGMTATGSGGFFGDGFGNGTMIQSGSVPYHWTDFISSVCGEELGFVGMLFLVSILVALMLRILFLSRKCTTALGSSICIGVFAMFFIQSFINLFMCIGMFPVIGITLPFFSYGGSSILSTFCAIGLVQCVVRHDKSIGLSSY